MIILLNFCKQWGQKKQYPCIRFKNECKGTTIFWHVQEKSYFSAGSSLCGAPCGVRMAKLCLHKFVILIENCTCLNKIVKS